MLQILLADDHDLMRAGLRYLARKKQQDWRVCGGAPNGRTAVELAEELRPGCASSE
jgi:YesN/AraC family two-component response regulator